MLLHVSNINELLLGLKNITCITYLDDVLIIHSKTFKEHDENLSRGRTKIFARIYWLLSHIY